MKYNKATDQYMCDRCGKDTGTHKMSWFNKENICMDCSDAEVKHPKFREAKEAVYEHERQGNMNWEGIGVPDELKVNKF